MSQEFRSYLTLPKSPYASLCLPRMETSLGGRPYSAPLEWRSPRSSSPSLDRCRGSGMRRAGDSLKFVWFIPNSLVQWCRLSEFGRGLSSRNRRLALSYYCIKPFTAEGDQACCSITPRCRFNTECPRREDIHICPQDLADQSRLTVIEGVGRVDSRRWQDPMI
jgi:hypothetical protein